MLISSIALDSEVWF